MFMFMFMVFMIMMILDEESLTDIDTELCPDGLDAGVDLLLMPHQGDPELHHLVHARHTSSSKVVRVPGHLQARQPVVHGCEPGEVWGVWCQWVGGLTGGNFPQSLWTTNEFVQCLDNAGEGRPVGSLLLPTIQHQ